MFDIGFTEIVVIAVVALIVIGPERLPKAARTMGHLFGRLQRYVNDVKSDINREIELDELRKLQKEVQTAAADFKSSVESAATRRGDGRPRRRERASMPSRPTAATIPTPRRRGLIEPAPLPNEPGGELARCRARRRCRGSRRCPASSKI